METQLKGMESLIDLNKILDGRAHDQGLVFTAMDANLRVKSGLSTGLHSFDLVLGGSIAPGRFTYFYGDTGTAKSTLMYHAVKSSLESSLVCVLNDHEGSVDPTYFKKLGIDLDKVCGARNKKGIWTVTPKLRYSVGTTAEATFKFMNQVLHSLPDKIQIFDPKAEEFRYFLISPEFEYKSITWAYVNKALKVKPKPLAIEVADMSPQMVFVTDSLRSMLPQARDEDLDKDPIALQARCFSNNFPLVKSLLARKNCIYLATNHLTIDPLSRFGCFQAETPVNFVDGRSYPIRKIVEEKIEGEVWSYDEKADKIVPRKIVDWHYNGDVEKPEDFITVTSEAVDTANGVASFTCTRNHKVLTLEGWKQAEDLSLEDLLVTKYHSKMNQSLRSFLVGTMVGDCTMSTRSKPNGTHSLKFQDKLNPDYVKWKLGKLDMYNFKEVWVNQHGTKVPQYHSESAHEFTVWKRRLGNRDPLKVIDILDDLSLAVWFMDDGHYDSQYSHFRGLLSVKRLKGNLEALQKLQRGFEGLGLPCVVGVKDGSIRFNKDAFISLCGRICKYVPECMQYKLHPDFRGKYQEFDLEFTTTVEHEYVPVLSIKDGSRRKFRQKGKYDISVEGTRNYMVGNVANGVIVHNSPEREPGGKAVQFYPDAKIKMHVNRAKSKIIEEEHASGDGKDRYLLGAATVLKNKSGPCFREIPYRIWLDEKGIPGKGLDPVFDTHTFLESCGLLEQHKKGVFSIKLKGFEDIQYNWKDFKKLVLIEEQGKDLKKQIKGMLADGSALEAYYNTFTGSISSSAKNLIAEDSEVIEEVNI